MNTWHDDLHRYWFVMTDDEEVKEFHLLTAFGIEEATRRACQAYPAMVLTDVVDEGPWPPPDAA